MLLGIRGDIVAFVIVVLDLIFWQVTKLIIISVRAHLGLVVFASWSFIMSQLALTVSPQPNPDLSKQRSQASQVSRVIVLSGTVIRFHPCSDHIVSLG